jgi:hypothetical protein
MDWTRVSKHSKWVLDNISTPATDRVQVEIGVITSNSINEMKQKTVNMHNEVLELIATLSDSTLSDRSSSVCVRIRCDTKSLINNGQVYQGSNPSHSR